MTNPDKPITDKWLKRQVWAVALFAASLSFEALMRYAADAGVSYWWLQAALPLALDGLIVTAIQAALSPAYSRAARGFAWFAVCPALAATVWANYEAHPDHPVVAFAPPVSFVLTAIIASLMANPKQPEPAAEPVVEPARKPSPRPKSTPKSAPAPKPAPKPEPAPKTEPEPAKPAPAKPAPKPTSNGAKDRMRALWDNAVQAGTELPTVKELAAAGGCNESYARRVRPAWERELETQTPELKVITHGH